MSEKDSKSKAQSHDCYTNTMFVELRLLEKSLAPAVGATPHPHRNHRRSKRGVVFAGFAARPRRWQKRINGTALVRLKTWMEPKFSTGFLPR
jgi:hypothetical protein